MKTFVCIVLVAFLGSISVQAYGPKRHYNNRGRTHGPPSRSPNGFEHSPHDSPTHDTPHGQHFRPPHHFYYFNRPYDYFEPTQYWDDSTEWDSGSGSRESDEYSSEYFGTMDDWHDHHHAKRPCKRHCKQPINNPFLSKTTQTEIPRKTQATVAQHSVIPLSITPNSTPRPTRTASSTEALVKTTSPEPTRTTAEEFTTLSPEIINCIDSCISTAEFNPVCGTDGETYNNEGQLFCAKTCGVDVILRRRSVCPPPIFFGGGDEETPPTLPPTTDSSPVVIARTTSLSNLQLCMKQCAITPSIKPICGTNFVTYINADRMECARGCGVDVELLCEKPCAACGITPVTEKPKTTPTTLTTVNFGRTTLKSKTEECLAACPATLESNPVCGTDKVTYKNPSHLLCAQLCGVGVSIDRFSSCPPTATPPSTSTTSDFPTSLSQERCFTRCIVTSEYNPVCGTDGETYSNPGNLECAKFCGIKVELKSNKPCELDFENENTGSTTPRTTMNINGNGEGLATVTRRIATKTSLFTSPIQTTTPVSTLTTTKGPMATSTTFSIPPNILNCIFGPTITQLPTTVINPDKDDDDDEDVDIDVRFSNGSKNNSDISRIIFPE